MIEGVAHVTTALFVPGDRPERFDKASKSGADLVIIDLEDAVGQHSKDSARANAVSALTQGTIAAAVRVNSTREGGLIDANALSQATARYGGRLRAVVLPKAETVEEIEEIAEIIGPDVPIVALIETAVGIRNLHSISIAPGVARLGFGALDFSADVDSTSSTVLDHARLEILLASRVARIAAPLDSPHPNFRDLEGVSIAARHSRSLGFGGQLCIHPAQLPVVVEAFRPSVDEIEWARRVSECTGDGATQLDGVMVDRPVQLRARAILARAAIAPSLER